LGDVSASPSPPDESTICVLVSTTARPTAATSPRAVNAVGETSGKSETGPSRWKPRPTPAMCERPRRRLPSAVRPTGDPEETDAVRDERELHEPVDERETARRVRV
jgi:hypothetical protein